MAAPNPRVPVKPARGYYAVVIDDLASIQEGELFYIKDQNTLYVKEGGAAVPIVGAGSPVTNSVRAGDNITKLVNNAGYITAAQVPADRVQSVNGQVGIVVVSADDIPTIGTTNKFVTQQDLNKLAGIQAGAQVNPTNVSELNNDAGYITDAGVTQIIAGTNVTINPVGGTGAVTINASGGGSSLWTQSGNNIYYSAGTVSVGSGTPAASDAFHVEGGAASVDWPVARFAYGAAVVPIFDPVGQISFSDNANATAASIVVRNNEGNWSGSAHPCDMEFYVTPQGSTTPAERFTITGDGEVYVGDFMTKKVKVTDDGKVVLNTAFLPVYSDPSAAILGGEEPGTVCVNGAGMLMIAKVIG